jgi:hypothetical protein
MADEKSIAATDAASTQIEQTTGAKRSGLGSKVRTVFAVVFGIIAVVGLFASVVGLWARSVLFDVDSVASAAREALSEQGATDSLATYVTDEVFKVVDLESQLSGVLPSGFSQYGDLIEQGAYNLVETQLKEALQNPTVQDTLIALIRNAHTQLLDVLQGDGEIDNVTIGDGKVTINVMPFVEIGLKEVQKLGLLERFNVPSFLVSDDPAKQIQQLESLIGIDLESTFAQLTVFEGDAVNEATAIVEQAQRTVVLVKRAITAILVVTAVALVLSILIANRHRKAALIIGLAAAVMMLVARVVIFKVVDETPALVVDPGAREALRLAIDDLSKGLVRFATWLLFIGLGVSAFVFLTGGSGLAQQFRHHDDGLPGTIITRNNEVSGLLGCGIAIAVALLWGFSPVALAVAGLIVVVSLWLLIFGDVEMPADTSEGAPAT